MILFLNFPRTKGGERKVPSLGTATHPSASLPNSADAPAPPLRNPTSKPAILVFLRLVLVIAWMDPLAESTYSVCQARIIVPGEIPGGKSWHCSGKHSRDRLWSRGLSPCSSGGAAGGFTPAACVFLGLSCSLGSVMETSSRVLVRYRLFLVG